MQKSRGAEAPLFYLSICRCAILQSRAHRLNLGVHFQHILAHFAAPARLLVAAKWHGRIEDVVTVNPHRAGAELRGETMGLADITRPDACRQAVDSVISASDDLFRITEGNRR